MFPYHALAPTRRGIEPLSSGSFFQASPHHTLYRYSKQLSKGLFRSRLPVGYYFITEPISLLLFTSPDLLVKTEEGSYETIHQAFKKKTPLYLSKKPNPYREAFYNSHQSIPLDRAAGRLLGYYWQGYPFTYTQETERSLRKMLGSEFYYQLYRDTLFSSCDSPWVQSLAIRFRFDDAAAGFPFHRKPPLAQLLISDPSFVLGFTETYCLPYYRYTPKKNSDSLYPILSLPHTHLQTLRVLYGYLGIFPFRTTRYPTLFFTDRDASWLIDEAFLPFTTPLFGGRPLDFQTLQGGPTVYYGTVAGHLPGRALPEPLETSYFGLSI